MSETKMKTHVVEKDHGLLALAEELGVDPGVILQHNETVIRDEAAARGFAHAFQRVYKDDTGRERFVTDFHIFPGTELRLPDDGPAKDTEDRRDELEGKGRDYVPTREEWAQAGYDSDAYDKRFGDRARE